VAELRFPLTLEADSLKSVDDGLRLALDASPDLVTWAIPQPNSSKTQNGPRDAIECLGARVCEHVGRADDAPTVDRGALLERVMAAYKRFSDEFVVSTSVDDVRGRYISQHLKASLEATFGPRPVGLGTIAYWDVDLNPLPPADPQPAAQAWLSPGARTPRAATVEASPVQVPDLVEMIPSPLTSLEAAATLHPLSIVKLLEALRLSGLDRFIQPIFNAAGEPAWPGRPPTMPIDERRLARVHQALRAVLMPDLARQVLDCAGRLTADEIIEARVPRRVQGLAAILPSAVSNYLLVYLFRRNTRQDRDMIMGSGTFEAWAGQPSVFERKGNPLCAGVRSEKPICAFHSAVIRELFRVLVSRSVEVVETQCEACGDPCCRHVVAWGSAGRQKKMFDRLGIDPHEPSRV
jgi:divinyl protochlorophyllide a 8-vinyl-reductase